MRKREERERLTDEVADIESLVVGPESVVIARVPAAVGAHNMVCGSGRHSTATERQGGRHQQGHGTHELG